MNDVATNSVCERLEQMERRLMWLRRAFILSLVALFGLVTTAILRIHAKGRAFAAGRAVAGVPEVIEAGRFVVVDQRGRKLAVLSLASDGSPELGLTDRNGEVRAALAVTADGSPALALSDRNEKNSVTLGVIADGSPALEFSDRNRKVFWRKP